MLTLESFEEASEIVKKSNSGNQADKKAAIFQISPETKYI